MRQASSRRATLPLALLLLASLWMYGCNSCDPAEAPSVDGDRDSEPEANPPEPPVISTDPTHTGDWGRIDLPELKASLGFPPELAVVGNTLATRNEAKVREILLTRPTHDGRLDLLKIELLGTSRDPEADTTQLLAHTRELLADRTELTLDLQEQRDYQPGGEGSLEITQLFHFLAGRDLRRIRRVVWLLPDRFVVLNFEAEDSRYRALGSYVGGIAEHFRPDAPPSHPTKAK